MVQKRFEVQTSAGLESVIGRKIKADRAWTDDNAVYDARQPVELAHAASMTTRVGDYFLAPGGRWAFLREETGIAYADLESPARGWKALIQHDNVANTHISYEMTQESSYFSLRLAACGVRKRSASDSETCFSVHSISVTSDKDGNIDGLQAALLSVFSLDGHPKIDALNVYQDRMAVAFAGVGIHRIIDWRAADRCKNTFPEIRLGYMPPSTQVRSKFALKFSHSILTLFPVRLITSQPFLLLPQRCYR